MIPTPPPDPGHDPNAPTDYAPHVARGPFDYQPPTPHHTAVIQDVRAATKELYEHVLQAIPPSVERNIAIRKLEEFSMWANKAIVFDGERYLP